MEWEDYLEDNLELARAEARAEGILEGKAKGILEAKAEGILEGKLELIAAFVREGVISEDVAFSACDDPEALRKLLSETV